MAFVMGLLLGFAWAVVAVAIRALGLGLSFGAVRRFRDTSRARTVATLADRFNAATAGIGLALTLAIPVGLVLAVVKLVAGDANTALWAGLLVASLLSLPLAYLNIFGMIFSTDQVPSDELSRAESPPVRPDTTESMVAFVDGSVSLGLCAVVLPQDDVADVEAAVGRAESAVQGRDNAHYAFALLEVLDQRRARAVYVVPAAGTSPFPALARALHTHGVRDAVLDPSLAPALLAEPTSCTIRASQHVEAPALRATAALLWALMFDREHPTRPGVTPPGLSERVDVIEPG